MISLIIYESGWFGIPSWVAGAAKLV